jgi:1,4-alpha-glucan branching enzyme
MTPFSKKKAVKKSTGTKKVVFVCSIPHAKKASVAGDFNTWSKSKNAMKKRKSDGAFVCAIALKPGRYEYRFVVNGSDWVSDPKAKECCANDQGGMNCVVNVT